ncbi:MAG: MBL fold metallo-hydrolase, partial [Pseudomonas sp.]
MRYCLVALSVAFALSSSLSWAEDAPITPAKAASPTTAAVNQAVLKQLPFQDRADYEAARRGLVAAFEGEIKDANGKTVWNSHQYDFLKQEQAPDTVNPSLWRLAQLNANAGLFQVTDRIYQVRGIDLANMTIIEGDD